MGPSPIGGSIYQNQGRVNQNGNETRETEHVHFALCAADLTAAAGVCPGGGRVQRPAAVRAGLESLGAAGKGRAVSDRRGADGS